MGLFHEFQKPEISASCTCYSQAQSGNLLPCCTFISFFSIYTSVGKRQGTTADETELRNI